MYQRGYLQIISIILITLGVLAVGNLILLNLKIFGNKINVPTTPQAQKTDLSFLDSGTTVTSTPPAGCDKDCQKAIDLKIANLRIELIKNLNKPAPTSAPATVQTLTQPAAAQSQPQVKELFISFGGTGTTSLNNWTDVSGSDISFDASSYPGAKFYFQANLKSDAPDRAVYARVFDVTNKLGVPGSDVNYTGLSSSLKESGTMTFQSGRITLRVQIHSQIGNLTTVENPRIRIVY